MHSCCHEESLLSNDEIFKMCKKKKRKENLYPTSRIQARIWESENLSVILFSTDLGQVSWLWLNIINKRMINSRSLPIDTHELVEHRTCIPEVVGLNLVMVSIFFFFWHILKHYIFLVSCPLIIHWNDET